MDLCKIIQVSFWNILYELFGVQNGTLYLVCNRHHNLYRRVSFLDTILYVEGEEKSKCLLHRELKYQILVDFHTRK